MRTQFAEFMQEHPQKDQAEAILRQCVHCGFCTATCPTYQLLGDENDGPRGRIYLIKQVLEGQPASRLTQQHLDRCLTCRSCETTCPSGVEYVNLLEIGRAVVNQQVTRPISQRLLRQGLQYLLPRPGLFKRALKVGQSLRPILPKSLRASIPITHRTGLPIQLAATKATRMLLLSGCVQPALSPATNQAARKVFAALGIELIELSEISCCGAVQYHLDAQQQARQTMRQNIAIWTGYLDQGITTILSTASGCGLQLHQYAEIFAHEPDYADQAKRISAASRDISDLIKEHLPALKDKLNLQKARDSAWHSPCTLQHGLKRTHQVEQIWRDLGLPLKTCQDAHLCCGSAGTYSILQSKLAKQLRDDKLSKLQANQVEQILTANIGCQLHLQSGTATPVKHWIEHLAELLHDE